MNEKRNEKGKIIRQRPKYGRDRIPKKLKPSRILSRRGDEEMNCGTERVL